MAGTITPGTIKHEPRGVMKISNVLASDAGGEIPSKIVGVAFGKLVAVGYKVGTTGAGIITIKDSKSGVTLLTLTKIDKTVRYLRPTAIATTVAGVALTPDAVAPDVRRDVFLSGPVSVAVTDGGQFLGTTTGANTGDLWTASEVHGLVAGDCVVFDTLAGGTGFSVDIPYFVIAGGLTATVFGLSATRGGSLLTMSADATAATWRKVAVFGNTTTGDTTGGALPDIFTTGAAHGLAVGDAITFIRNTGGTLPTVGVTYYVLAGDPSNLTTTFQLSATLGGAAIEIGGADMTVGDWFKNSAAGHADGTLYLVVDESDVDGQ